MKSFWANYPTNGTVFSWSRKRMILFKFPKPILYMNYAYMTYYVTNIPDGFGAYRKKR